MDKHTYLGNTSSEFLEEEYSKYKKNPESVEFGWRKFFEGFEFSNEDYAGNGVPESYLKEFQVINLINAYRQRGHLFTYTNPVRERRKYTPTLAIENFGLGKADLDTVFNAATQIGIGPSTLRDIEFHLHETYCKSLGVEYTYIRHPEKFEWKSDNNVPSWAGSDHTGKPWEILTRCQILSEEFCIEHNEFIGNRYLGNMLTNQKLSEEWMWKYKDVWIPKHVSNVLSNQEVTDEFVNKVESLYKKNPQDFRHNFQSYSFEEEKIEILNQRWDEMLRERKNFKTTNKL